MGIFQSKKSYQVEKEGKKKGVVEQRSKSSHETKDARNTLQMKEEARKSIVEAESRYTANLSNDLDKVKNEIQPKKLTLEDSQENKIKDNQINEATIVENQINEATIVENETTEIICTNEKSEEEDLIKRVVLSERKPSAENLKIDLEVACSEKEKPNDDSKPNKLLDHDSVIESPTQQTVVLKEKEVSSIKSEIEVKAAANTTGDQQEIDLIEKGLKDGKQSKEVFEDDAKIVNGEPTMNEIKIESYSFEISNSEEITEHKTESVTKEVTCKDDFNRIDICKSEEDIKEIKLKSDDGEIGTSSTIETAKEGNCDIEVHSYRLDDVANVLDGKGTTDSQTISVDNVTGEIIDEKVEAKEQIIESEEKVEEVKVADDPINKNTRAIDPKKETEDKIHEEQLQTTNIDEINLNKKENGLASEPDATNSIETAINPKETAIEENTLQQNHVQQEIETLATEKQEDPLSAILKIEQEVKTLKDKIILFTGTTKDKQYLALKEMLVGYMIKLDDIVITNSDENRNERKRVIKFVQESLETLQRNVVQVNASSDEESDKETKN